MSVPGPPTQATGRHLRSRPSQNAKDGAPPFVLAPGSLKSLGHPPRILRQLLHSLHCHIHHNQSSGLGSCKGL
jgi:hypothetical protein